MFHKKIQAATGSFQYRRPTQPSPTFSARTMRSASPALWNFRRSEVEGVRDGNITVDGLPEVASEVKDYSSQFQVRSNKKRNNNI